MATLPPQGLRRLEDEITQLRGQDGDWARLGFRNVFTDFIDSRHFDPFSIFFDKSSLQNFKI